MTIDMVKEINEYIWVMEDTPEFIAGRITAAAKRYREHLLPPFFGELVQFSKDFEYSWHTPGHAGGTAFMKSPGRALFHDFFGEQLFRSDLSISVGELGSLLDHSGPVGEAERYAAKVFGADHDLFCHKRHLHCKQDRLLWPGAPKTISSSSTGTATSQASTR